MEKTHAKRVAHRAAAVSSGSRAAKNSGAKRRAGPKLKV